MMKSSSPGPNALSANNNAQHSQRSLPPIPQHLTAEAVAALPPPGLTGPTSICFSASSKRHSKTGNNDGKCYLAFLSTTSSPSTTAAARRFHHPRHPATSGGGGGGGIPRTNHHQSHNSSTPATTGERQLCAIQMNELEKQEGTITTPMSQGQIQLYTFPLLKLPLRNSFSTSSHSSGSGIHLSTTTTSSSATATATKPELSLEERLRRERQRLHASGGVTQFSWTMTPKETLRILVPLRGNIYIQNDVGLSPSCPNLQCIYDKNTNYGPSPSSSSTTTTVVETKKTKKSGAVVGRDKSAIDPQLSPDGSMVAFVMAGDIYVMNAEPATTATSTTASSSSEQQQSQQQQHLSHNKPVQITFGASTGSGSTSPSSSSTNTMASDDSSSTTISDIPDADKCISHGLADFVAQEEMDRYRGYWWDPQSQGILFTRVDETCVPPYRITHQGRDSGTTTTGEEAIYEDHRYPFAGKANPQVTLGYVKIDRPSILGGGTTSGTTGGGNGTSTNMSSSTATSSAASMTEDMSVDGGQQQQQQQPSQERKTTNTPSQTQEQQQRQKGGDDIQMLNYYLDGDDQRMDESTTTDGRVHDEDSLEDTGIVSVDTAHTRACTIARENWLTHVKWLDPPPQAKEYLARINWLPDGTVCAQWQNRLQSTLVLVRIDIAKGTTRPLYVETSDLWINLNHMMRPLPKPIHPDECDGSSGSSSSRGPTAAEQQGCYQKLPHPLPEGSFSFLFASERTGFSHLYLYTYVPGYNEDRAILVRQVSGGDWMVESIAGVDMKKDVVYVTGTHESPLERHLYALPLTNRSRKDSAHDSSNNTSRNTSLHNDGNDDSMIDSPPPNSGGGGGGVRRGFKQVISAFGGGSKPRRNNSSMNNNISADDSPTPDPIKLTTEPGMHSIVMDDNCKYFVDTTSDLGQPTSVKVYKLPEIFPFPISSHAASPSGKLKKVPRNNQENSDRSIPEQRLPAAQRFFSLFDSCRPSSMSSPFVNTYNNGSSSSAEDSNWLSKLPAPELLSYPTSDGTETLHAALYRPDPQVFGPGPYPLICAVYGGPHVQRVSRSWAQCADMRAQRLRSFGFAVVKCDNRGSSRRGLAFESAVRNRLGRLEVLDQVTTVRQLVTRGIADPNRVGIYGWSYGGYLAAMCLCRAPDVFHVAVSGAPVTSWDGYDTHYTERYMGLPADNPNGYRESAVFDHVPNMRGKLMIVHGLIDENVHFRHTARLINRLIAAGKDYDLLIFPDERHSPRRLRDRIYMEQRISDYFLKNLCETNNANSIRRESAGYSTSATGQSGGKGSVRPMVGHL